MPQLHRPKFASEPKCLANEITVECRDHMVVYFSGLQPIFQHAEDDLASFRMFTSTLVDMREARPVDITKTFEVPLSTVKRYLKLLRVHGKKAFFADPNRRSSPVLKGVVQQDVERLIAEGKTVPEVAKASSVKANTLHKAIRAGRVPPAKKNNVPLSPILSPLKANGVRPTVQL